MPKYSRLASSDSLHESNQRDEEKILPLRFSAGNLDGMYNNLRLRVHQQQNSKKPLRRDGDDRGRVI